MEIINGQEVERTWIFGIGMGSHVYTYTADQVIVEAQSGATMVMNSALDQIFTLPEGTAANLGLTFTFANINIGKLRIQTTGGADKIADSAAGGYIESNTDAYAQITIRLVAANNWHVLGAHGTWAISV